MEMTLTAAPAVAGGVVGEKAEEDLSLGLLPQKLARTITYPFRMMNPFPSNSSVDPTFYNPSTHCRLSDVSDVASNAAAATSLQPFPTPHFKNPGVGMGTYLKYPFTWAQWKELERQALIYKHMVASAPIPPDLLIPLSNRTLTDISASANYPEPGRCRRTDGKKWRCSRDAAPDQKYCERHMHRGRPRSRKPVETRNSNAALSEASHQTTSSGFLPKPETKLSFPDMFSTNSLNKDRPSPATNPLLLQPYEDHLSLNFVDYRNGVSKAEQSNQSSCFYLNNDFASDPDTDQRPATFKENQAVPKEGNFSVSSLTLSIPETDMDQQSQMGGPLGEILALQSSAGAGSSSASSPSCVLQRAFASFSDSSSSSSPTFDAAKSEIALQWRMP